MMSTLLIRVARFHCHCCLPHPAVHKSLARAPKTECRPPTNRTRPQRCAAPQRRHGAVRKHLAGSSPSMLCTASQKCSRISRLFLWYALWEPGSHTVCNTEKRSKNVFISLVQKKNQILAYLLFVCLFVFSSYFFPPALLVISFLPTNPDYHGRGCEALVFTIRTVVAVAIGVAQLVPADASFGIGRPD